MNCAHNYLNHFFNLYLMEDFYQELSWLQQGYSLADRDRLSSFYRISNHKNFIPKYLDNSLTDFRLNFKNIEAAVEGKSSRERFLKKSSQYREIRLQVKQAIASFRCHDNSDVIETLIKFSSSSNTAVVVIFSNLC